MHRKETKHTVIFVAGSSEVQLYIIIGSNAKERELCVKCMPKNIIYHAHTQSHREDSELKRPRLNARQAHRSNVTVKSAEEYFRITYNEFLSHIIVTELEQRFSGSQCQTLDLLELLPELCSSRKDRDILDEFDQVVAFYSEDLPNPVMLPMEY